MAPETEATPAFPMSDLVKLRLSRMMGTRGAAAKVETKQVKKEIQDKWKVVMWGLWKENGLKILALFSESTGRENFDVGVSGFAGGGDGEDGDEDENAKICCLPVTPWRMELPTEPSLLWYAIYVYICMYKRRTRESDIQ